ncbi:hypothetical protein [Pontivivens ytuae]|uniref:Tim44-like domain protein n=1 Tax=Pontivivens ytuae TaxID=2789856 RepID=A0A7S9LTL4_9RHOB|nr:hypothetical protein [Pontivivens ytuae]QPH54510.1 hypothetical protein I0K15_01640 [Pontivivens ytuae]
MKPGIRIAALASVAVLITVAGALVVGLAGTAPDRDNAFTAPGLDPLTFDEAQNEFYRLTPALLLVVYEAFGRTGEDEIYDTLADVAHAEALEQLYLERVGAMAGGGLEEADQEIHEIKLLSSTVTNGGDALLIDASWQVIGTVGHAEHLHVRGNSYSADLTISPVDGAWKITDFELLDVSRDAAGETFTPPPTN